MKDRHLNEMGHENMMTKKDLNEMKAITYTNKVHLLFLYLNHKNFTVKRFAWSNSMFDDMWKTF